MTPLAKYADHRGMMFTFDLLRWRSESLLGWLIRLKSKKVNHTSVVNCIRDEFCGPLRVESLESLSKGFWPYYLSERLAGHRGQCYWHRMARPYRSVYWRSRLWTAAQDLKGTPYDFGALLANLFGYVAPNIKALLCTESIYFAGKTAGLPVPPKWDKKIPRPSDMLDLGWWEPKGVPLL